MNPETFLKLQSYLDNELPPAEAKNIEQWLERDAQARAIYEELRSTKLLLAGNELDLKVPESREFFWAKIEREIVLQPADQSPGRWFVLPNWCYRFAAPLAGAALLMVLAVFILKPSIIPQRIAAYFHEIDTPLEEDDAISFHSQEAGMTVVWIAAK